jgi:hypothetical protein
MDYPSFADAVARFRSFLDDQGNKGAIQWVFPHDVLLVSDQWFIRPRPQPVTLEEVNAAYHCAIARRLGVKFGVLCREGDILWCYIYAPEDRFEAECGLMPDGLKLSIPAPLGEGRLITDDGIWKTLRAQDSKEIRRRPFM